MGTPAATPPAERGRGSKLLVHTAGLRQGPVVPPRVLCQPGLPAHIAPTHSHTHAHTPTPTELSHEHLAPGGLGASAGLASDFRAAHDLPSRGFGPRVGLCADSSEPGTCIGFCVSLSLPLPLSHI